MITTISIILYISSFYINIDSQSLGPGGPGGIGGIGGLNNPSGDTLGLNGLNSNPNSASQFSQISNDIGLSRLFSAASNAITQATQNPTGQNNVQNVVPSTQWNNYQSQSNALTNQNQPQLNSNNLSNQLSNTQQQTQSNNANFVPTTISQGIASDTRSSNSPVQIQSTDQPSLTQSYFTNQNQPNSNPNTNLQISNNGQPKLPSNDSSNFQAQQMNTNLTDYNNENQTNKTDNFDQRPSYQTFQPQRDDRNLQFYQIQPDDVYQYQHNPRIYRNDDNQSRQLFTDQSVFVQSQNDQTNPNAPQIETYRREVNFNPNQNSNLISQSTPNPNVHASQSTNNGQVSRYD